MMQRLGLCISIISHAEENGWCKITSIDELVESGLFYRDDSSGIISEFQEFKEELTAQTLAKELNQENISMDEFYASVSYVEDASLWHIDGKENSLAFLPKWLPVIEKMFHHLDKDYQKEIIYRLTDNYIKFEKVNSGARYNPFEEQFILAMNLLAASKLDIDTSKIKDTVFEKIKKPYECGLGLDWYVAAGNYVHAYCTFETIQRQIQEALAIKSPESCTVSDVCEHIGRRASITPIINALSDQGNDISLLLMALNSIDIEEGYLQTVRLIKQKKIDRKKLGWILSIQNKNAGEFARRYIADESNPFRHRVFWYLAHKGSKKDGEFLLGYLKDPKNKYRSAAVNALGELEYEIAVPEIIEYMKTAQTRSVNMAVRSLEDIGSAAALEFLLDVLEEKTYLGEMQFFEKEILEYKNRSILTRYSFYELIDNRSKTGKEVFPESWNNPDHMIDRIDDYYLIKAIGSIGNISAVPFLINYIMSHVNNDKHSAYMALAKIGGEEALEFLNWCMDRAIDQDMEGNLWPPHSLEIRFKKKDISAALTAIDVDEEKKNQGYTVEDHTAYFGYNLLSNFCDDRILEIIKKPTHSLYERALVIAIERGLGAAHEPFLDMITSPSHELDLDDIRTLAVFEPALALPFAHENLGQWDGYEFEMISKYGIKDDLKKILDITFQSTSVHDYREYRRLEAVRELHRRLKPSGYNPRHKKLAA
ncbi:hypothetical protein GF323_05040 [Candidatus Woesearchaeota archaeon]|nr:hypothetical protein [Candidatus Woesearchaeota archaeon]